MATVGGTSGQSLQDTAEAVRRFALQNGYGLTEEDSAPGILLLTKGFSLLSWQLTLTVTLDDSRHPGTDVSVVSGKGFQLADWGRGKRAANDLLHAIGATAGVAAR